MKEIMLFVAGTPTLALYPSVSNVKMFFISVL
jgi:hypothetical protein